MQIPKIIHYCWFGGGEKPELVKKCIQSWKEKLPDYQIIEWNESNFDLNSLPIFSKKAMKLKKWAFVADYVRLKVLYENGGIYLDSDVEVFKSLDKFLDDDLFSGIYKLDKSVIIEPVILGSEKGHWFLKKVMKYYENLEEFDFMNMIPQIITDIFEKESNIKINELKFYEYLSSGKLGIRIYSKEIFILTLGGEKAEIIRNKAIKSNVYVLHYGQGTWEPKYMKFLRKLGIATFIANVCKKLGITKIIKKILGLAE